MTTWISWSGELHLIFSSKQARSNHICCLFLSLIRLPIIPGYKCRVTVQFEVKSHRKSVLQDAYSADRMLLLGCSVNREQKTVDTQTFHPVKFMLKQERARHTNTPQTPVVLRFPATGTRLFDKARKKDHRQMRAHSAKQLQKSEAF